MTKLPILAPWVLGLCLLAAAAVGSAEAADDWALEADIAESCSCDPACPCLFGSPMTNDSCEGSRLYEIDEAHFGEVSLDGLEVIVTFQAGKWTKYYVSEKATDRQLEVLPKLIARASPMMDAKVLSVERAPITVERSEKRVKFASPHSTVEIEMMPGRDGKAIEIDNLSQEDLEDYVQYKSVVNSHKDSDHSFQHSGTNGFTSTVDRDS